MTISPLYIATNGLLGFGAGGGGSTFSTATVVATFGTQELQTAFEGPLAAKFVDSAVAVTIEKSELVTETDVPVDAESADKPLDTEIVC